MRMPGFPSPSISLCFCTCPDAATAGRIAAALVEERLAACVSIVPGVHSIYRWQGAVERAEETLLLVKTAPDRLSRLQDRLLQLHPQELPELVSFETGSGLPAYLQWVAAQTRPEPDAE
jgi:periplasmic divalent cation tolerance protein